MSDPAVMIDDEPTPTTEDVPVVEAAEVEAEVTADAPEPEKKKVEFTAEQQEFINENIVGEKVRKQRAAEAEAAEYKKQAEDRAEELAKLKQPDRPEIPPVPDPYEDDYAGKIAERDQAILAQAQYDGQIQAAQQRREHDEQQAQAKTQAEFNVKAQAYADRSQKLGINTTELHKAGETVVQSGIDQGLIMRILTEDQGPAITMYLGKNPGEADAMARMDPFDAAIHLENIIKPAAIASRPKPDLAPEPAENPNGAGFAEDDGGLAGVRYE